MVMLNWFVPDPTPVLTGPRVVLRPPRSRDYDAWRQLRRDSRDFLKPFEPRWTEADLNRQAYGTRLVRGRGEARRGTDFSFLIFERVGDREVLAGGLTISNIRRRAAQYANLGYWMGEAFAGRVAASLLKAIEMPELVTNNLADYEALALALARDPARLTSLKEKLARNIRTTPLFDADSFRRDLETAYLKMAPS